MEIETKFQFQSYLENITSRNLRKSISKISFLCAHNLRINTGRYVNLDRHLRVCQVCDTNVVEYEFHFVVQAFVICSIKTNLYQTVL